mgnify:CR=1 FL=1
MLSVKKVDHISQASPDFRRQLDLLGKLLGFSFLHEFRENPGSGFIGGTAQVRGTGMEWEVIEPSGPESFVQRFLDERGPGLHHITIEVEDIYEAASELERQGITPFGGIVDDGMWHVTYIHPRDSGGVLYQLFVPHRFYNGPPKDGAPGIVGLNRVDHVSVAARNRDDQAEWQHRVFGMEELSRWEDEVSGYKACVMSIPNSKLKFEIMEPRRPDSFVQKFIDERGPGMHHVCCEVESVDRAAEALRREGIEPFGGIIESDWRRHTFIHPRDSGGVLFQLFEEPGER